MRTLVAIGAVATCVLVQGAALACGGEQTPPRRPVVVQPVALLTRAADLEAQAAESRAAAEQMTTDADDAEARAAQLRRSAARVRGPAREPLLARATALEAEGSALRAQAYVQVERAAALEREARQLRVQAARTPHATWRSATIDT